MRHTPPPMLPRRARGISLVEIMVALVIGLLVVLAAVQVVVANRAGFRTRDDAGRIVENGQFAIDLIHRHVRLAGYQSTVSSVDNVPPRMPYDNDFGFGESTDIATCAQDPNRFICGANDQGAQVSDVLAVRFRGFSDGADANPDGSMVDCAGVPIGRNEIVEERFMIIDSATAGRSDLVCYVLRGEAAILAAPFPGAPGGVPIVLAEGVRRMQVLYGIGNIPPSAGVQPEVLFASQWVIPNAANPNNLNATIAVRVALMMEGNNGGGASTVDTTTYNFFGPGYVNAADAGATFVAPGDTLLRKIYSTTIAIRNRMR